MLSVGTVKCCEPNTQDPTMEDNLKWHNSNYAHGGILHSPKSR